MQAIPLVSVCIQTYQHENFIRTCLDGVLQQQTNFPFEIIIGEDDSTDGTRAICQEYAARYPDLIRLFLRSEKDKIYVDGLKTGRFNFLSNIKDARGRYIALLDGDDYWTDEKKLQKQVDWMEAEPAMSICAHSVYWRKENGKMYIPPHLELGTGNRLFSLDDLIAKYFLHMSSMMFRKKDVVDLPPWYMELQVIDYPLAIHLAQKGSIGFMNETMGVYNIHEGGMWSVLRPPHDVKRLWKLFTSLAIHYDGKIRSGMRKMREGAGKWLIYFYRSRSWHDHQWFIDELQLKRFEEDRELLQTLKAPYTLKGRLTILYNFSKAVVKKMIGRK
jgi:glycosyltransferase involved in cell wall biosynthesis